MNITVDLHDYTAIEDDLRGEQLAALAELFRVDEYDAVDVFCDRLQDAVRRADARNICLLNSEEERVPTLVAIFNGHWWTQGYVGVVRFPIKEGNEEAEQSTLTVNFHSRFDTDNSSRFLMYVFEKAFHARGRIYDRMDPRGTQESTWDYLLMISFAGQLREAMKKGMFRQYREYDRNDSNVRGRIDVVRYIRENTPPNGKIAYTTREYTVDNMVNVLILKAFDCMDRKYHAPLQNLTAGDEVVKKGLQLLRAETEGWQEISNRQVLKSTNKKIVQSVYRNYEPLRRTAIAILRRLGVNQFVNGDRTASGLLIDMPGLWEVFLHHTIFSRLTGQTGQYMQYEYPIIGGHRIIKPDFLLEAQKIVLDAKYKTHWGRTYEGDWRNTREDIFQVLSYMNVFQCTYGGVIFPVKERNSVYSICKDPVEKVRCPGQMFLRIPYVIPNLDEADEFRQRLEQNAEEIIKELGSLM